MINTVDIAHSMRHVDLAEPVSKKSYVRRWKLDVTGCGVRKRKEKKERGQLLAIS